jgi:hypothetical protein
MRLGIPGIEQREHSNQYSEGNQADHGNPPRTTNWATQVAGRHGIEALRDQIGNKVNNQWFAPRRDEQGEKRFSRRRQNRVRGIAHDDSNQDPPDVSP